MIAAATKKEPIVCFTGGSCDVCSIITDVVYILPNSIQKCTNCYIVKNRPKLQFVERNHSGALWSRENQCTEQIRLSDLEMCGWFLRSKEIEKIETLNNDRMDIVTYTMQYYGNIACPRCSDVHFSKKAPPCKNPVCRASSYQGMVYDAWVN